MSGHGYFGGTRLQSVCTVPGCPALCEPGRSRCQDHARLSDRDGRAWRAQRELVLERDDHRCQAVLLGAHSAEYGGGLQVHHIRDVQAGGGDELENLVALCRSHNNAARRARSPRWLPALERYGPPALARSPATPSADGPGLGPGQQRHADAGAGRRVGADIQVEVERLALELRARGG